MRGKINIDLYYIHETWILHSPIENEWTNKRLYATSSIKVGTESVVMGSSQSTRTTYMDLVWHKHERTYLRTYVVTSYSSRQMNGIKPPPYKKCIFTTG